MRDKPLPLRGSPFKVSKVGKSGRRRRQVQLTPAAGNHEERKSGERGERERNRPGTCEKRDAKEMRGKNCGSSLSLTLTAFSLVSLSLILSSLRRRRCVAAAPSEREREISTIFLPVHTNYCIHILYSSL